MINFKLALPTLGFLLAAGAAFGQSQPRYAVTDLGSLGGTECAATAINNRGVVVGGADTAKRGKGPEFITNVFVWRGGRMRAVPGLDGSHAYVVGVNDAGTMAGAYSPNPLKSRFASAVFAGGRARILGGFPSGQRGYSLSQAEAINQRGQVVGVSNNQAFFWDGKRLRRLAPPVGYGAADASAVNDRGQAAGKGDRGLPGKTRTHALLWDVGGHVKDLGVLPGYTESVARAVNNNGQVAGWAGATGGTPGRRLTFRYQAFLWQNGHMRGLGSIPRIHDSKASAINNRGQVVGNAYYRTDEAALLWQNGRVYELNTLVPRGTGWKLQNALGINDHGQIVGNGIHNGIRRGFLLTPTK